MLTYLRSDTLLVLALLAVVGADAYAPAYLALAPSAAMLAYLRSTTLLHWLFMRLIRVEIYSDSQMDQDLLVVSVVWSNHA